MTPSAHRVHHGQNAPYIDKNYAGVFILWDRLFGSYAEEKEPVVYGIGTPVRTFNPLSMQFKYWNQLWADARASTNRWDLLRVWFMPTGWRPANRRHAEWPGKIKDCRAYEKYDRPIDARTKIYVLIQFATIAMLTAGMSAQDGQLDTSAGGAIRLVLVLWSAWSIGLLLDQQLRAKTESIRLLLLVAGASAAIALQPAAGTIIPAIILSASLVSLALLTFVKARRAESEATPVGNLISSEAMSNKLLSGVKVSTSADG